MFRTWLLVFAFIAVFQSSALPASKLTLGVHNNFRTLEFETTKGHPSGALIDCWKLWAQKNNTEIEFVSGRDDELIQFLQAGKIDVIANVKSPKHLSCSQPYFIYDYYLFSA